MRTSSPCAPGEAGRDIVEVRLVTCPFGQLCGRQPGSLRVQRSPVPTGDLLPLLIVLLGLVAVGQLLRLTRAVPENTPDVLSRVILTVTMPALFVGILADARFEAALIPALIACTVALFSAVGLAVLFMRSRGASRASQGTAGLVSAFGNTAFLGVPLILAVFPGKPGPATAGVIIDTIDTAVLMLTFGIAFAGAMGQPRGRIPGPLRPRLLRGLGSLLRQPIIIAALFGAALAALGIRLPAVLTGPLLQVGQTTSVLAFLAIGIGLDLRSLRGQAVPLAGICAIKLLVAPAIACLVLLALGTRGDIARAAVLQSAMPTAVLAAIIATNAGCDAQLGAAASVVTVLLSLVTVPLVLACLQAIAL